MKSSHTRALNVLNGAAFVATLCLLGACTSTVERIDPHPELHIVINDFGDSWISRDDPVDYKVALALSRQCTRRQLVPMYIPAFLRTAEMLPIQCIHRADWEQQQ